MIQSSIDLLDFDMFFIFVICEPHLWEPFDPVAA